MGMTVSGIDVSNWQGHIDWRAVRAAGYRFAWVLATDGSSFVDGYAPEDVDGCNANDVAPGAYHFARPARHDAEVEARWFVGHLPDGLRLPHALDLESDWLGGRTANTDWALRWFDVVQPRVRVIYTNLDGINSHLDSARLVAAGCRLWLAHPGQRTMAGAGAWPSADAVQVGQTPINGVAGNVDFDIMSDDAWPLWSGDASSSAVSDNGGDQDMTEDEHNLLAAIGNAIFDPHVGLQKQVNDLAGDVGRLHDTANAEVAARVLLGLDPTATPAQYQERLRAVVTGG